MNAPNQPVVPAQGGYQAGSLVVTARPNEFGFPLREDEFQILCGGESTEARAGRDLCIGISMSAVIGSVSLCATVDWPMAMQQEKWSPFVWLAVLLVTTAGGVVGWIIFQQRLTNTSTNSPYARLKRRIEGFFIQPVQG